MFRIPDFSHIYMFVDSVKYSLLHISKVKYNIITTAKFDDILSGSFPSGNIFDSPSSWGSPFLCFGDFLHLQPLSKPFKIHQSWSKTIPSFSKRPSCSFAPSAHPNCQPFCMNSLPSLCLSWPNIPGPLFQYSGPWKFYPREAIKRR